MKGRQGVATISLAVGLWASPACNTQKVGPTPIVMVNGLGGPGMGGFVAQFAPRDPTVEQAIARVMTGQATEYDVMIDDDYLMVPSVDGVSAVTLEDGGECEGGYLDAGPHRFRFRRDASVPIFDGEGQVPAGGTARLFLFGAPLQGLFVPVPEVASAGHEHVTVVNLIAGGQMIEVVSCTDAATCSPLSPALGLGDLYDAELPAVLDDCSLPQDSSNPNLGCGTSLTATGAGIGYRLVPSPQLPAPTINPLRFGGGSYLPGGGFSDVFVAAPVYVSDQGASQYVFN